MRGYGSFDERAYGIRTQVSVRVGASLGKIVRLVSVSMVVCNDIFNSNQAGGIRRAG